MINVEVTQVQIRSAINTPFRVVALFVVALLVVIIVLNAT